MRYLISFLFCLLSCLFTSVSWAAPKGIIIDTVVASVDGEPITLSDVKEVMGPEVPEDLDQLKKNPQFPEALEKLISEKLLDLELKSKNMQVSESDISEYISRVATHNGMSVEEFKTALANEGKSYKMFRRSVRLEIMRSKVAGDLLRAGGGATDAEVEEYIKENYDSDSSTGTQIKISQIYAQGSNALERCQKCIQEFNNGKSFSELAQSYSDGPNAKAGGSLGVMQESDLNPLILDAIRNVNSGKISEIVQSENGCHVFFVEDKFEAGQDKDKLQEEVRAKLNQQKIEEKFQTYFINEIYKNHTVEKKIF